MSVEPQGSPGSLVVAMIFGAGAGLVVGVLLGVLVPALGVAFGIPIGMAVGLLGAGIGWLVLRSLR